MSEETSHNDGTLSGLKKTIIGTVTTLIAGGGTWLGVALFNGGGDEKQETKTEQAAPAAPVVINLQNNNTNQQKQSGTNTVIRERVIEKPAATATPAEPAKPAKKEEESW